MRILLTYYSYFGNTRLLAYKILQELQAIGIVTDCIHIKDVKSITGYDYIFIGSPTRDELPPVYVLNFLLTTPFIKNQKIIIFDTRIYLYNKKKKPLGFFVRRDVFALDVMGFIIKLRGGKVISKRGFNLESSCGPISKGEIHGVERWIKTIELGV